MCIYNAGQSWVQQSHVQGTPWLPHWRLHARFGHNQWLVNPCMQISSCSQEEPFDAPYHHGQHYQDLPDTMHECDMWVHRMYYELVSDHFSIGWYNVLFSLALPLVCHWEGSFTWPCCRKLAHYPFILMKIFGRKHPCSLTVRKITQDFMNYAIFSDQIQPWEEEM